MAFDTDDNSGFFAKYKVYLLAVAVLAAGGLHRQRSTRPMPVAVGAQVARSAVGVTVSGPPRLCVIRPRSR